MSNPYIDFEGFEDPLSDKSVLLDARGARKTQTLFVDVNNNRRYEPLYTMREYDYKGYISAYQIFMHSVDEYDAALKLVGSIDHWNKLCGLKWFNEGGLGFTGIVQWRKDMVDRDNRMAKKALIKAARNGDATAATKLANWAKTIQPKPVAKPKEEKLDKGKRTPSDERNSKIAQLHKRIK